MLVGVGLEEITEGISLGLGKCSFITPLLEMQLTKIISFDEMVSLIANEHNKAQSLFTRQSSNVSQLIVLRISDLLLF